MGKVYFDQTELKECIGIILDKDTEVIPSGATISSMSPSLKSEEYRMFAEEYDINFIFNDNIPQIDFYTVPHIEVIAVDSVCGYIAAIGYSSSDSLICYIDKNKKCWKAADSLKDFIESPKDWKNRLVPYDGIIFYKSKDEAEKFLEFVNIDEIRKNIN